MSAEAEKRKYISEDGREKTFQFDEALPDLPLPSLSRTLDKYLDSVIPHSTNEELENTKRIVNEFKNGIGLKLHSKLLQKSRQERNWLEKWWEDEVYLSQRTPIYPFNSMGGSILLSEKLYTDDTDANFHKSALTLHYILRFWKLLTTERLRPQKSKTAVLSMHQWRRIFNCCQIPGETKDHLVEYFKTECEGIIGPTHVTVLHKGHIFIFDAVFNSEILNPLEIFAQIKFIQNYCSEIQRGPSIGTLTCDNRNTWYKNRLNIISIHPNHSKYLHLIESSLFVIALDDEWIFDELQMARSLFGGEVKNRWADKSMTVIVSKNGLLSVNNNHTPFDAIAPASANYYAYLCLKHEHFDWQKITARELPKPEHLNFHIDDNLSLAINSAIGLAESHIRNLDVGQISFAEFGKELMTSSNKNPDYLVQLAVQLGYYRQHFKPAPTYETATTRRFWHGRTETVRSCTCEAISWVKAMLDPNSTLSEKTKLMVAAYKKHESLMNEAMMNEGCDRHLFGLYQIAVEDGIPVPDIYLDKSFTKSGGHGNFILSTSLLGYFPFFGGTVAMCNNGYGIFYGIQKSSVTLVVTAWKSGSETDAKNLCQNICKSLREMKEVLLNIQPKSNL